MNIQDTMLKIHELLGIPVSYSRFRERQTPPYIIYRGNGQTTMPADNTYYYKANDYQIEYYFDEKDERAEERIEKQLLADGFMYDKSDDTYIEEENISVIYYQV